MTIKLRAEKAATTPNYKTNVLLMDMSKAYDRVERTKVMEDLQAILEDDELHMVKVPIKDVKLKVKIGDQTGIEFSTKSATKAGQQQPTSKQC